VRAHTRTRGREIGPVRERERKCVCVYVCVPRESVLVHLTKYSQCTSTLCLVFTTKKLISCVDFEGSHAGLYLATDKILKSQFATSNTIERDYRAES